MTTSQSPVDELQRQANQIASNLKAMERGETPLGVLLSPKMGSARSKESIKFAVAMDDKVIEIEMTWVTIAATSEAGIAEYILVQMRGRQGAMH